ncbi:glycosyltransferase [Malikia sp.]|uniref:glycosyltransferase n=1 Tax=Malikia sp. TaxID=2070706 RepID=UPI00261A493B|nr:glycosyltransferase [Malikia sp.]MDD2727798.1 glycosyltransferase [Malikia sp.]
MNAYATTHAPMITAQTPFFTVIIATYNAAATICKSIDSVLAQTEHAQILVMDGLSNDNTASLARRYEPLGVAVYSEKDHGVYDAWNKGLEHARGEWIIFLGADDYYDNQDSLYTLRQALTNGPKDACLAYGLVEVVDAKGQVIAVENKPWNECRDTLRKNMPYTHVGSAHHASIFRERRFDPEFRIAGDYNFLYPILTRIAPVFVSTYIVKMGHGGLSTSFTARLNLIREIKQIRRGHRINAGWRATFWLNIKEIYYSATKFISTILDRQGIT